MQCIGGPNVQARGGQPPSADPDSISPFDRLCKLDQALVPNHCWQMLKLVLVECFHLTIILM